MAGRPKRRGRGGASAPATSPRVWEKLQPGHELTLSHGAYSDRRVSPVAERFATTALEQVDYLRDPSYTPALLAWARTEARIELLETWLDDNGMVDDDGKVAGAANLLAKFESQAAKQRERLGMDPLSRAKIRQMTASTSVDVAQLMASEVNHDDDD